MKVFVFGPTQVSIDAFVTAFARKAESTVAYARDGHEAKEAMIQLYARLPGSDWKVGGYRVVLFNYDASDMRAPFMNQGATPLSSFVEYCLSVLDD